MWRRTARITKHFPDGWTESGRLCSACVTKVPSRFLLWQILLTCYFAAFTHAQARDFPAVSAPHSQVELVQVHVKESAKLSQGNSVHKVLNMPYTLPPGEGVQISGLTSYRKKTFLLSPKLMSSNTGTNSFQPTWLKGSKMYRSSGRSKRALEQGDPVFDTYNWRSAVNDMIQRMLGGGHDIPPKGRTQSSEDASTEKSDLYLRSFRNFGAFKRYLMSDNKVAMGRSLDLNGLNTPEINVNVTSSRVATTAGYTSKQAVTALPSTETQTLSHTGVDVTMKTEINSLSSATHYPLTTISVTDDPSITILNISSISHDLTSFTQKRHLDESSTDGWRRATLSSGPSKDSGYHTTYGENESMESFSKVNDLESPTSTAIPDTEMSISSLFSENINTIGSNPVEIGAVTYSIESMVSFRAHEVSEFSDPQSTFLTPFSQDFTEQNVEGLDSQKYGMSTAVPKPAGFTQSPQTNIPDVSVAPVTSSSIHNFRAQPKTISVTQQTEESLTTVTGTVRPTESGFTSHSSPHIDGTMEFSVVTSPSKHASDPYQESYSTDLPELSGNLSSTPSPIMHIDGTMEFSVMTSPSKHTSDPYQESYSTDLPELSGNLSSTPSPIMHIDGTMEFSVMTSPSKHASDPYQESYSTDLPALSGNLSSTPSAITHVSESTSLVDSTEDSLFSLYISNVSAAFTTDQMSTSLDQVDLQTPSTEDYLGLPIQQDDPTFLHSATSAPSSTYTELTHMTSSSISSSIFSPSSYLVPSTKEVATTHFSVTSPLGEQTASHPTDRNVTPVHVTTQAYDSAISVTLKLESPMNATTSPEFDFNSTMEEVSLSWLNHRSFKKITKCLHHPKHLKHSCPQEVTSTASVPEARSHNESETSVVSTQTPHTWLTNRPTTSEHSTINDTKDHLPGPHVHGPITMRGDIAGLNPMTYTPSHPRVNETAVAIDAITHTSIDVPTTTPSDTGRFFDSYPIPDGDLTLPTSNPPPINSAPLKIRILGVLYSARLQDKRSEEYAKLEEEVTLVLNKIFSTKYDNKFLHTNIGNFLNGSVIVHAEIVFANTSPSGSSIVRTLLSSNLVHQNVFGWSIDTSSVESQGFTPQNLEPKILSIYFLVLHVGFMAENYSAVRLYLETLNQGVMLCVRLSFPGNFSISKIRDLNGDLEVRGNLSLDTTVDPDVQAFLQTLLPLANLSVDLSSVVVDGQRIALRVYPVTFRITNRLFHAVLLDMSSFRFKELSINLSAVVKSTLQKLDPSQVIIREFRSGSTVCRGIIMYKLPAPGSRDVLQILMGSLGSGGTLGSSPYIIDVSSLRVGDSTPGTNVKYVHFPGFAVAIIVMCGLCLLIVPFVAYACTKTNIFGHSQKASFSRRNNPDRHSHQFEMDNRV